MGKGIAAGCGVVIEWFELFGGFEDPAIVPEMERDRLDYAAQPGFIRKLLIVGRDAAGAESAGGVYFLDDPANANKFLDWATETHVDPDGRVFSDREYVGASEGYVGELLGHVGAHYDDPVPAAMRVQRFALDGVDRETLARRWTQAEPMIGRADLLGCSLVYDADTSSAFILSISGQRSIGDALNQNALDRLATLDLAEQLLGEEGVSPQEDLLFWVFTVWEGYGEGEAAPPATWPNSPPLPHAPYWKG